MFPYPNGICSETEFHEVVMYMMVAWLFQMLMLSFTEAYGLQENGKRFEDPIYQIITMLKGREVNCEEHHFKGKLSKRLVSLLVVLA